MNKFESLLPKDALCQTVVEIGLMVVEKKIVKSRQCIFSMSLSFPLCKGHEQI